MSIFGNVVGGNSGFGKTFIIEDEAGNQLIGVVTENVQMFDAVASTDIREGKTAVTDAGIVTGSAFIPNYQTNTGYRMIPNGSPMLLKLPNNYNYTKLQAIVCTFNTSLADSVGAEQVVIDDQVFSARSTDTVSIVKKDAENDYIDFGFINTSGKTCLIRYFMYRELY